MVFSRGSLQLKVEVAAKSFAKRQTPRAIDAAPIGRMNHELHTAGFIKESFKDNGVKCRQCTEGRTARSEIGCDLRARGGIDADVPLQPLRRVAGRIGELRLELAPQPRNGARELIRASRRFTKPEWNARRLSMRIFDTHSAALDAQNFVGSISELKYIALQALDRKILVHSADEMRFRLQNDAIVRVVGNRTARSNRGEPGALSRAHDLID